MLVFSGGVPARQSARIGATPICIACLGAVSHVTACGSQLIDPPSQQPTSRRRISRSANGSSSSFSRHDEVGGRHIGNAHAANETLNQGEVSPLISNVSEFSRTHIIAAMRPNCTFVLLFAVLVGCSTGDKPAASVRESVGHAGMVDATSVRGKVMCGYQGWFRCPDDAANLGWIHWSRDSRQIVPDLLTFEMWPDMTEYSSMERYPALGFTYPGGGQADAQGR